MANKSGKRRGRVKEIPFARELPGEERERAGDAFEVRPHPIYLSDDDRVVLRLGHTEQRVLVEWHIGYQIKLDGRWADVVTYDCSHGSDPHRHVFRPTGRRAKKPSKRVRKDDLRMAGELAEVLDKVLADLLEKDWEKNRRRFLAWVKR